MTASETCEDLHSAVDSVGERAREEAAAYAGDDDRPLGGYAVLLSTYATTVVGLGAIVRRRQALPERLPAADLALLGVATHKLSRLIAKDSVGAVFRAPFTTFEEPLGNGEVHDEVRGKGLRHAVGELVTCPFCLAVWTATALAYGLVLAPRATRLMMSVLSAVLASDVLQLAYGIAQRVERGD